MSELRIKKKGIWDNRVGEVTQHEMVMITFRSQIYSSCNRVSIALAEVDARHTDAHTEKLSVYSVLYKDISRI